MFCFCAFDAINLRFIVNNAVCFNYRIYSRIRRKIYYKILT